MCYICAKYFIKKLFRDTNYRKVRDHCHYTGKYRRPANSICNLKFNVPFEIPVVFHNGLNYDYHSIIKELASEFDGPFECIGENSEIYRSFSVPMNKEVIKIDKDGTKSVETISYKINFIDSMSFMATSLTKLLGNLSGEIHKTKYKECGCLLQCESVRNNLIK